MVPTIRERGGLSDALKQGILGQNAAGRLSRFLNRRFPCTTATIDCHPQELVVQSPSISKLNDEVSLIILKELNRLSGIMAGKLPERKEFQNRLHIRNLLISMNYKSFRNLHNNFLDFTAFVLLHSARSYQGTNTPGHQVYKNQTGRRIRPVQSFGFSRTLASPWT
jgi:hypothetical protein